MAIEMPGLQSTESVVRLMKKMRGLFSDVLVTATELNRRAGAILDVALETPVTITRNDQHFALLPRNDVAQLHSLVNQLTLYVGAVQALRAVQSGGELPRIHAFHWLHAFDSDDWADLLLELESALREVVQGDDAGAVEGVIHEWRESAKVAECGTLQEAFGDVSQPVILTAPEDCVEETFED